MVSAKLTTLAMALLSIGGNAHADRLPPEGQGSELRVHRDKDSDFEELFEFTEISKYKKASLPVGFLMVEFRNRRNGVAARTGCTATLLDAALVLTASHCLKDPDSADNPVEKITLWLAFDFDLSRASPYEIDLRPIEDDAALDYAILKINGATPTMFGVAVLVQNNPQRGEELFVIHHPGGVRKQITRRLCRVVQIAPPRVRHSCHTVQGSSGAPLFSDNDGSMRFLAIHTGWKTMGGQTLNEGTLIADIAAKSCIVRELLKGPDTRACASATAPSYSKASVAGERQ